jgi:hypothetical protein
MARLATTIGDPALTDSSLLKAELCPRQEVLLGGGPDNKGTRAWLYQDACMRSKCSKCTKWTKTQYPNTPAALKEKQTGVHTRHRPFGL